MRIKGLINMTENATLAIILLAIIAIIVNIKFIDKDE